MAEKQDHLGTPSDSQIYGEGTCSNIVDYRVLGIPLSTVEQQDAKRENMVKTLIEKFEKHQRKESYIKDLSQTQKINEVQQRIAGTDCRHEQHRDLRTLRKFFQTPMS